MRLRDVHNCTQKLLRFRFTPQGIEAYEYAGSNPYPVALAYHRADMTIREASPTGKKGGTKMQVLTPPIDYMAVATTHNQYPRGVYRPDRALTGRTAATGFVDPYIAYKKPTGNVSKDLRFIP